MSKWKKVNTTKERLADAEIAELIEKQPCHKSKENGCRFLGKIPFLILMY